MLLVLRAVLLLLGWASLLHASRRSQTATVKLDRGPGQKHRTLKLVLDPSVLPPFTSRAAASLADMSLSPWTYRQSYVPSRFPERISQAVCSTGGCLNPRGGGEDATLKAQPIKYEVLVLHRVQSKPTKRNKKPKMYYRLGTEVITVGCTCVRPSVVTRQ